MPNLQKMNLNAPELDNRVIARHSLIRMIEAERKIVFIYAPAGYGKTTAAALWAHSRKRNVKWISLIDLNESELKSNTGLETAPNIVLDGFQARRHASFAELLLRESYVNKLVITSRNPPPVQLSELFIKNASCIIGMDCLRLNREEIRELLHKYGFAVSEYTLDIFEERTAGWPALIVSAIVFGGTYPGLSIRGKIDFCSGKYFAGQIYKLWNAERSAVLESALTDYIESDFNKKDVLSRLSEATGFLLACENNKIAYHALFKDYLLSELHMDKSVNKEKLFNEAALCGLALNSPKTALELAVKSGNVHAVETNLKTILDLREFSPGAEDLHRFACDIEGRFPAEDIVKMPLTSAVCVWKKNAEGKSAEELSVNPALSLMLNIPFYHKSLYIYSGEIVGIDRLLQRARFRLEPSLGSIYPFFEKIIMSGLLFEKNDLDGAEETLAGLEPSLRCMHPVIGLYFWLLKSEIMQFKEKNRYALEALKMAEKTVCQSGFDFLMLYIYAYKTKVALYSGDFEAACEWLEKYSAEPTPTLKLYHIFQYFTTARSLIAIGSFREALKFLDSLLVFSERCQRPAYMVEAIVLRAACRWFIGKKDSALEGAVEIADKLGLINTIAAEGKDILPVLEYTQNRMRMGLCKKELDRRFLQQTYMNSAIVAKRSYGLFFNIAKKQPKLSQRQLFTLKLLALNMTYVQIADEMGVKITTVRDHISRLYEKLGVNNSNDAVIRGRELKLI